MNIFSNAIIQVLSSQRLSVSLAILWIFSIWGSIWYLASGHDDGVFFGLAIAFKNEGDLGLYYINHFQEFFIYLPGYPFIQAVFFLGWDFIGLPINLYTYKTFNLVTNTLLLLASYRLLVMVEPTPISRKSLTIKLNLFLILLGASPFIIDFLYMRPEPLGLLLTLCSILLLGEGNSGARYKAHRYFFSAFFLGIASVSHPTFIVTSGGLSCVAIIFLIRRRQFLSIISAFLGVSIPILCAALWYLLHQPQSFEMLALHVSGRVSSVTSLGAGVSTIFNYMMLTNTLPKSLVAKLYYAVCFWVLFLTILLILIQVVSGAIRKEILCSCDGAKLVITFFAFALLNALVDKAAHLQIYTVLGFSAVLAVVVFLPRRWLN